MRGEQPWRTNRARVLRSRQTQAEEQLWARLRNRQLGGFKFVRQFPVDGYFLDFACRTAKLVIEVDGGTHGLEAERTKDHERQAKLERHGWRFDRVTNEDVRSNLDGVLEGILAMLEGRLE